MREREEGTHQEGLPEEAINALKAGGGIGINEVEKRRGPWASRVVLLVKNPPAKAGDVRDMGLIPGSRTSPGGGHGNPLQCSCLVNRSGAWQATVQGGHKKSDMTEHARTHSAMILPGSWNRVCQGPGEWGRTDSKPEGSKEEQLQASTFPRQEKRLC